MGYVGIHAGIEPDCIGDFNDDGRADMACALGWIEKDNAVGTRWTEHWNTNVFLGVDGTYHVAVRTAVRDLNGDGYPDVIQAECLKGYLAHRPAPFLFLENTTSVPEEKRGFH